MKANEDKPLELAVHRELRSLPELTAPVLLANRVMAAIEQRAHAPWHRRSWQTWPVGLQVGVLATMLALFGGLCFAGWELSRAETFLSAMHRTGQWFSGFTTIRSLLNILAGAIVLVIKKMGTTFVIACLVAAGLGYTLFMGLGTIYFRLAFSKR